MPLEQSPAVFVQRLSIWKTLGAELFLLATAVFPLTHPNGLVYTAFLYRMPFFIFLVCASVGVGLLAVVFLLLVWRALLHVPVLIISDTAITVLLATRTRSVSKSDVLRIVRIWPGANVNLEIRGARPLALPVWFYEQPALVMKQLEPLATDGEGSRAMRIGS